jgi:hypothetical protein
MRGGGRSAMSVYEFIIITGRTGSAAGTGKALSLVRRKECRIS